MKQHYIKVICLLALIAMCTTALADDKFKYTTEIPEGILTPNEVKTSIGTLDFTDGVPSRQTADKVYDFMDTSRAADAFLKGIPAASVAALNKANIGSVEGALFLVVTARVQ